MITNGAGRTPGPGSNTGRSRDGTTVLPAKKDTDPMGRFIHCRCASWHRFWLVAGVCALLLPGVSRAEDPVDELRDALKIITHIDTATKKVSEKQRKDKRDDVKTTIIPNLKTISQL